MGLRQTEASPEARANLEARFQTAASGGAPSPEQIAAQHAVRTTIVNAARLIDLTLDDSREKSLALTHLEEALMWTGKGIFA